MTFARRDLRDERWTARGRQGCDDERHGRGLLLRGDNSGLVFEKKTTISLTAPTTASMAVSDDGGAYGRNPARSKRRGRGRLRRHHCADTASARPEQAMRTYRIISDNARTMLGTIYHPLRSGCDRCQAPVADQSAYTVVVAQRSTSTRDRTSTSTPTTTDERAGTQGRRADLGQAAADAVGILGCVTQRMIRQGPLPIAAQPMMAVYLNGGFRPVADPGKVASRLLMR